MIEGFYKKGIRDSIWSCYDYNGNLTLKYNYTTDEILYYNKKHVDNKKYRVLNFNGQDTILTRNPIYLGGDNLIQAELAYRIHYPASAVQNGITGIVNLIFTVDR